MWLGARKGGEGRESFAWDDGSRWEYTGAWLGGVHLEHHHHLVHHHHHHHLEHHHSTGGEGGPGLACLLLFYTGEWVDFSCASTTYCLCRR